MTHTEASADEDLLEQWRSGDREAGDALFRRHFDAIYRFFARKVDGDPGDLVHNTFVACVEGKHRFEGRSSFRSYLFGIARNHLYDHWKARSARDKRLDFGVTSISDLAPTPSWVALRGEENRLLLEALRSIPLDLQIAIELRYWEDMSGPELADALGIKEGTVRSRLRRAKEKLEERIRALAETSETLKSTLTDLDSWARGLRDLVAAG